MRNNYIKGSYISVCGLFLFFGLSGMKRRNSPVWKVYYDNNDEKWI